MSSRIKLTKKGSVVMGLFGALLLTIVAVGTIWYINNRDTQVAPTDSSAATTVWCGHCPQDENGNYINCCSEGFNGDPECTNFNGEGCFKLYTDDDPACLPASNKDYSGSVEKTYVFFCESLSCTISGGVLAKRCDNQNKIAVFEESGRVDDTCSVLTDGKLNGKPCGCFAYQVDWVGSGTDADGWKMGEASLSGADCEPPVEVPPTCTVTNSAQCVVNGTDVSANVTWNVTGANFTIGSGETQGDVVIRLNNLDDGTWHVEGNDTYWATYYQEFISSGKNPVGATWNFDVRTGTGGEYDSVVAGVNYDVYAAVYAKKDDSTPACVGPYVPFKCDPGKLSCSEEGCTKDADCNDGLTCTAEGLCRNPECPKQASCNCPIIPTQVECNESCTEDKDCKGALVCTSGMCREASCTDEPTCICPTGSPVWKIDKSGAPTCVTGKETYAQVFYTVIVRNSGDADGELPEIVDTLDTKVLADWVNTDSIEPAGEVVGNTIIWSLTGDDATFEPGEEMVLTYSVNVPKVNFGEFTNVVEGRPTTGGNFSDDAIVEVSCVIPVTGIFDTTQSKIVGAGVMLVLSAVLLFGDFTDKGLLNIVGKASDVSHKYSKPERTQRSIDKSRDRFEDEL